MACIPKTVKVDGKTVRYFTNGVKDGCPVLVLHGFMSDATSLTPFVEALDLDRPVIIPDLPGFGESDQLDGDVKLQTYVEWLNGFMQALAIKPDTIVGYSFGAYIAMIYTGMYVKDKKTKLILLTPVIKISWRVRVYGRGFRFMAVKARKLAERLYLLQYDLTTYYLHKRRHPSAREQLIERRRGELAYLNPELVLKLFGEFLELDLSPYAKKIRQPVIVVMASGDNVAANSATKRFSQAIKTSAISIEINHAGHLLPIEDPVLLAASLSSYITRDAQPVEK